MSTMTTDSGGGASWSGDWRLCAQLEMGLWTDSSGLQQLCWHQDCQLRLLGDIETLLVTLTFPNISVYMQVRSLYHSTYVTMHWSFLLFYSSDINYCWLDASEVNQRFRRKHGGWRVRWVNSCKKHSQQPTSQLKPR